MVPPMEYPGHFDVRRVSSNGCISWKDTAVFLTESLAGDIVGLEEVDEGLWTVYFGSVALARFDDRQKHLYGLGVTVGRAPTASPRACRKV